MNWIYRQPAAIHFGAGTIEQLPALVAGYRAPLIVCDRYFADSGLAYRLKAMLGTALVYSDISPNPDVSEVNRCASLIRESGADIIAAVGGGSALDLAKAASAALPDIEEYHGTGKAIPAAHIPVIAVPTTAGTGSEVTCIAVLTDRSTGKKCPIVSDSFYPVAAVVDPALTCSVPPAVTASTGIDVLCHAVEGYWSRGHQPICDALAVHAANAVFQWLPTAFAQPGNMTAREKMAEASVMAGLAFTLPKTTAPHACSFPLTAILGIPHGEACALTLDFFTRVNAADARTQQLAQSLGCTDADALADRILALKQQLHLRTDLKDLHLSESQTERLVQESRHPNLKNNPVEVTDEMLCALYQKLTH